jgi:hypothetical protein
MYCTTATNKEALLPRDIRGYWEDRRNHDLYRLMVSVSKATFPQITSAIDVGSYISGLIVEMDWIEKRVATDIQAHLADNWKDVDGVQFIGGDAFQLSFPDKFDLVISNQTIEHLEDPAGFVKKLANLGKSIILSTTFETPAGMIEGHIQDPISMEKFLSWFPVYPDSLIICHHPSKTIKHIVAIIKDTKSINKA